MEKRLNERKRLLNEGPGAGYSITLGENETFKITNKSIEDNTLKIELEVSKEYSSDFDILNAEGYDWDTQYGRKEYDIETPLKSITAYIDIDELYEFVREDFEWAGKNGFEDEDEYVRFKTDDEKKQFIIDVLFDQNNDYLYLNKSDIIYGAGWSHSPIGNPVTIPIGVSYLDIRSNGYVDSSIEFEFTSRKYSVGTIEFDFDYGSFDDLVENASDYYEAYRERYVRVVYYTTSEGEDVYLNGEEVYFYDLGLDNEDEDDTDKIKTELIDYLKNELGEDDIVDVEFEVLLSESNKRKGKMIKEERDIDDLLVSNIFNDKSLDKKDFLNKTNKLDKAVEKCLKKYVGDKRINDEVEKEYDGDLKDFIKAKSDFVSQLYKDMNITENKKVKRITKESKRDYYKMAKKSIDIFNSKELNRFADRLVDKFGHITDYDKFVDESMKWLDYDMDMPVSVKALTELGYEEDDFDAGDGTYENALYDFIDEVWNYMEDSYYVENKKVKKNLKESRRANDGMVETLQLTSDFVSNNYDEVEEMLDSIEQIDISKAAKNFYDFFANEDYGTYWVMLDSRLAIVAGKDDIPENYVPDENDDFFPYQIALKDMRHDDFPDYDWIDQPLYNENDVYDTEIIYKECPSMNEIERTVSWIYGEYGDYIEKLKELYDDFYEEQWGDEDNPEEDLPKEKYFSLPRDLGIDDSNVSEDEIKEAIEEYLYMDYHDLYPNYWVKSIDIDVDRYGKSVRADIHWVNDNEDLEECNNITKLRESIKRKFKQRMYESRKRLMKEGFTVDKVVTANGYPTFDSMIFVVEPTTWKEAKNMTINGGGIWRLPTTEELFQISNSDNIGYQVKLNQGKSAWYWSSTGDLVPVIDYSGKYKVGKPYTSTKDDNKAGVIMVREIASVPDIKEKSTSSELNGEDILKNVVKEVVKEFKLEKVEDIEEYMYDSMTDIVDYIVTYLTNDEYKTIMNYVKAKSEDELYEEIFQRIYNYVENK